MPAKSSSAKAKQQLRGPFRFITAPTPPKTKAHPWPIGGYVLMAFIVYLWFSMTTTEAKVRGLIGGLVFSVTEYVFHMVTIEKADGSILVRPFDRRCRKGHTTFEQFFMNVLTLPFFIETYQALVWFKVVRAVAFPLLIWAIEIFQGYVLIYLYGYNKAWTYKGSDAFFHGSIKLSFGPYWVLMGFVVQYLLFPLLLQTSRNIASKLAF
ncbi:uncharacterized protein VTP21DRAFT_2972 [Calcarisporiella thermophila]|uniref:uncharacterized protein n=1 Tax=Calcarisporiella thermophila TaxID=911321 RepID=UPI0037449119